MRYEVFDPRDGTPIFRTRFRVLALLVRRLLHHRFPGGLDTALEGEGW